MHARALVCAVVVVGCGGARLQPGGGDVVDAAADAAPSAMDAAPSALDAEPPVDGALADAAPAHDAGGGDGGAPTCQWSGAPGTCMTAAACSAIADHSPEPGSCAGPPTVQCCIDTPDVADNPPVPAGYKLMMQSQVTPAMTNWAVAILHDPVTYPMFSTATQTFGTQKVLARVEWHPPDFQNSVVHRGVTLYVPG